MVRKCRESGEPNICIQLHGLKLWGSRKRKHVWFCFLCFSATKWGRVKIAVVMNLVVWFFSLFFFPLLSSEKGFKKMWKNMSNLLLTTVASRMRDDTFLAHGFLVRLILQIVVSNTPLGLLLLWALQTKKIYSVIFFYLFFVSQQPNGHRRRVDFNAWRSQRQSTKGRWPWAQKQHSQSSCPGAPPPGLPPAPPSIHPPYPIIRVSKPVPTPYTGESHHHIILLFPYRVPLFLSWNDWRKKIWS